MPCSAEKEPFPGHPYPRLTNPDDPADLVLDLAPVLEKKIAAAVCHRSQHALFVRRRTQEWGRPVSVPEAVLAVEGVRRLWPEGSGDDEVWMTG